MKRSGQAETVKPLSDEELSRLSPSARACVRETRTARAAERQRLVEHLDRAFMENVADCKEQILSTRSTIEPLPSWLVKVMASRKLEVEARRQVEESNAAILKKFDKETPEHELGAVDYHDACIVVGRPDLGPRYRRNPGRER